jgi:thiol-disulfide isomerase/thioredoxin
MKNAALLILFSVAVLRAQEKNIEITEQSSGKPILIGLCDRSAFADSSFAWWFNSGYDSYSADSATIKKFYNKLEGAEITIVMGSWCSDSRREVPRLFKILDKVNFNQNRVTLYCVDRGKKEPSGRVEKLSIKLVPTIIVYRNETELGRITESPEVSLEKDLLKIISRY